MNKLNELIAQEIAEWERLSGYKEKQIASKKDSSNAGNRRQMIHGGYSMAFMDSYPIFQRLQPQPTEPENDIEFAPVELFYSLLANDKELVERLINEVNVTCSKKSL